MQAKLTKEAENRKVGVGWGGEQWYSPIGGWAKWVEMPKCEIRLTKVSINSFLKIIPK